MNHLKHHLESNMDSKRLKPKASLAHTSVSYLFSELRLPLYFFSFLLNSDWHLLAQGCLRAASILISFYATTSLILRTKDISFAYCS